MKLKDFKRGMFITHPLRGEGYVIKVTKRTIVIGYEYSVVKSIFKTEDAEFEFNDI